MVALLRLERPDDGIRGEEDGLDLAGARRWLLDPVDGTLAFVQGIPLWTVVAALRDQERTLVSAIYDPVADELFSTQWDGEVLCNSQVASPPQGRALAEAIVRVNFEQRLARSPEIKPIFSRLASSVGAVFTGGSGSLALAWVATGHLHAYVGFHPTASDNEWDWLPGALMVERAGGVAHVSGNWYLAASTAALADELLALVLDAH
jgi:myo-inositol-1(or 4)-monophosphatase